MRWGEMRWPNIGEIREVSGFLWLPKRLEFQWRWLEYVTIRQQWDGSHWINKWWDTNPWKVKSVLPEKPF